MKKLKDFRDEVFDNPHDYFDWTHNDFRGALEEIQDESGLWDNEQANDLVDYIVEDICELMEELEIEFEREYAENQYHEKSHAIGVI